MTGLALWLRRGTGRWVCLLMVVAFGLLLRRSSPWVLDADWGNRFGAGSVVVFAPLVAAAAAYDIVARAEPSLALAARSGVRGRSLLVLPASLRAAPR